MAREKDNTKIFLSDVARLVWGNASWCWYSPWSCAQYATRDTGQYFGFTAEQITNEIVRLGL